MYTQKKKNRKDNYMYMYMKMVKVNDCWSIKTKNVSEVKVRVNDQCELFILNLENIQIDAIAYRCT